MKVEQYVMAYGVEHDRLRAIIPDGFQSLRPVLRINAEIQNDAVGYVELNTAIEKSGIRGWLNIAYWKDVPFERKGAAAIFKTDFLELSFTAAGLEGSCPAEKDNVGCYFINGSEKLRAPENITTNKEFCACTFRWKFTGMDACGTSVGKTLPAYPTEILTVYPKKDFTAENAAQIPCQQVLGAYVVKFIR